MDRPYRLIDVIVVGACLAMILLGLAMPRRHTGHRIQCSSNMRQVGLAIIQYINIYERFPPSQFTETGTSGFVMALPYMEAQDLYNAYNLELPRWSSANASIVRERFSILECPENPNQGRVPASTVTDLSGRHDPGNSSYAKGHYAVNWGGDRTGWGRDFTKSEGVNRGLMRAVTDIRMGGPLPLIRSEDMTDGTSTTLLITEKRDTQGWAVGGWAGSEFDVGISPVMETGDRRADKAYSGSYHDGGVWAVCCDGSAHFLTTAVNRKVWYALVTRDGGEPIVKEGNTFTLGNKP